MRSPVEQVTNISQNETETDRLHHIIFLEGRDNKPAHEEFFINSHLSKNYYVLNNNEMNGCMYLIKNIKTVCSSHTHEINHGPTSYPSTDFSFSLNQK